MTRLAVAAAVVAATLIVPATARAIGGPYVVTGGTAAERRSVTAALDASSFDWNAVPAKIAVHVVRGADSFSTRGEIWLDADLLDAGKFAWGVVRHEYAHQVDYFRFDDAIRARSSCSARPNGATARRSSIRTPRTGASASRRRSRGRTGRRRRTA